MSQFYLSRVLCLIHNAAKPLKYTVIRNSEKVRETEWNIEVGRTKGEPSHAIFSELYAAIVSIN